ncbi:flagellar hook protein FlgE [Xanthobacter sediminis]|uniref:flagellar hook protein FlgE n=1 Tax=Xanthobacter sediminis TaxID=3119926 RepID=UPI0037298D9F
MSLYGMMRTSVSGMGAQSNLLSTVGDNIANASTTGYKAADAEFSSVMLQSQAGSGDYQSGSVKTTVRYAIDARGALDYVGKSNTDLAIQGNGFFLVTDTSGQIAMTRAGDFRKDASTGNLVNGAGYTLMGYPVPSTGAGGTAALVPVNINNATVTAAATTTGVFSANLPISATSTTDPYVVSKTVYDAVGSERTVNLSFQKTANTGEWTVTVSGDVTTTTATLQFDSSGNLTTTPATLSIPVVNSQDPTVTTTMSLDLSGMTQKDMGFTILTNTEDGTPASVLSDVSIDTDGTVYAVNANGDKFAIFTIPLGYVSSPNNLTPLTGNAYTTNTKSGALQIASAEENGQGSVISGATENSTVDTANELTTMIVAQRDYTANSKVFQTGAELLDVLMNLKR